MTDSILESVAEVVLGTTGELDAFTPYLITYINSALMTLCQLGIGKPYFKITGTSEKWDDFADNSRFGAIQEYVIMKVKLAFDPPQSSAAVESIKEIIKETEWRLTQQADPVTRGEES